MGEPSITDLAVRLVASLAIVVGLLLLIARTVNKRFSGSGNAVVQVVHRQTIGRGQNIAVVSVGGRMLVLGATEHQVTLLTEVDPEDVVLAAGSDAADGTDADADADDRPATTGPFGLRLPAAAGAFAASGPLGGSLLSPQTWRQTLAVLTRRGGVVEATPADVVDDAVADGPDGPASPDFAALLAELPAPDPAEPDLPVERAS